MPTDRDELTRAITHADNAADQLREAARTPRRGTGEPVSGSHPEPPAPLNLTLFDQAEQITWSLDGWARMIEEETGEHYTPPTVTYLRRNAAWAADQPWADDMLLELRDHTHAATGMLGTLPKRTLLATLCECGAEQHAYQDDGAYVQCREGHRSELLDQNSADSAELTTAQAAQLLGVSAQRIRILVKNGRLRDHGRDGRILIPAADVKTYRDTRQKVA